MTRRIVTFGECDTPDEVVNIVQELFDNQELIETKLCQIASSLPPTPAQRAQDKADANAKRKAMAAEAKAADLESARIAQEAAEKVRSVRNVLLGGCAVLIILFLFTIRIILRERDAAD